MDELLSEYRSVIDEFHPQLSKSLRPGLSRDEVESRLSQLPFAITPDAVDLYAWADGVDDVWVNLIPISSFMPLDRALKQFSHLLPHQERFEQIFPQQYRRSFCFLWDRADGGFGFGSLDPPCDGRIIGYDIHDEWSIAFDSLSDLVRATIHAYRTVPLDEEGEWDIYGYSDVVCGLYPHLRGEWT